MKQKLISITFVLCVSAFFLFGCQSDATTNTTTRSNQPVITTTNEPLLNQTQEDSEIYSVYLLAVEAEAYAGTYEEWLEEVKGPQGEPGKEIQLRLNDVNLEWRYEDETSWSTLFDLTLLQGNDGVGIQSMIINSGGQLIITYSDNRVENLGSIVTVYSVEFQSDSGLLYSSQMVGVGGDATPPTNPTKTGHDFIRWEGEYENVTANTSVTAVFQPALLTISFDSNGGTTCDSLTEVPYGTSISLPEPTKPGYVFLGWFQGDSINSAPFYDGDVATGDHTLFARWELSTHVVCFEDEDGNLLLSENVPHGNAAYLPASPPKEGHTFTGWDQDTATITQDTIIRPIYIPNNYTLQFNTNGGSAVSNITLPYLTELPSLPETDRIGYAFMGWYANSGLTELFSLTEMPLGGGNVYAKWQICSYSLTFDTQGGNEIEEATLNYNATLVAPEDPFREFYDFVGWSSEADSYVPFSFTTMPANDLNLYAIWKTATLQFVLLESDTYGISGVNPIATEVVVPSTYKEKDVTQILAGAFQNGALVTSLTIADSVLSMEPGCLSGLAVLEQLSIPFVGINREATGYDATLGVLFGTEAFAGSQQIMHYFPSITRKAYQAPASLTKLMVSDATILRAGSLSGLVMLKELVVSDSVTTIEEGAFAVTLSLRSMTLPFLGISITSWGNDALLGTMFGRSSYGVVATALKQGNFSYYLPTNLESLMITGGDRIESYALMNLRNLREVSIPMTMTYIGNMAFYNDISLSSIVLPDQLTTLGFNVFDYDGNILPTLNPALNAVVLPATLREVGSRVFGLPQLNPHLKIYAMVTVTTIYGCWDILDDEYEVIYNAESIGVYNGLNYVSVKNEGVTMLGVHFGYKLSQIVLPRYIDPQNERSLVNEIAPGAFSHHPFLEELWLGESIRDVGYNSVGGDNLTVYLTLPYIPEWWGLSSWNPTNVPVLVNQTMPQE